MLCVGVSPKGEHQYALNVVWIYIICVACALCLKNTYMKFYSSQFIKFPCIVCTNLMGLTSLTEMSESNFTPVFWILILLHWKRSLLLLLILVAIKRKAHYKV